MPSIISHECLEDRLIALLDRREWALAAKLIDSGADIHYGNGYAFRTAVACNAPNFASWLLDRGADPSVCEIEAWQHTIQSGNLAVLKLLMKVSPPDRGRMESLLVLAAQEGKVKSVKCLLEHEVWSPKGLEAAVLSADRRGQTGVLETIFEIMLDRRGLTYVSHFISFHSWPHARACVRSLLLEQQMMSLEPIRFLPSRMPDRRGGLW